MAELEDGMIRSPGLGANCVPPLSAIVESLTPQAADIHYVGGHDAVIRFRSFVT